MAQKPPKALLERAVKAAQLHCGSVDRVAVRQEQKLYNRMWKAIDRIVAKTGMDRNDAGEQIQREARRRGCKLAMPGQDI